jgi:PAS domain S-box-containing protein
MNSLPLQDVSDLKSDPTADLQPPAVDRRDRLTRQQAAVAMGRRAVAAPDLAILMQDAAALIAETLSAEHSCVAELAGDGSWLAHTLTLKQHGAAKPTVFLRESDVDGDDSLAAYALKVAHLVRTDDVSEDTRFSDPFLQKHGIRSAIAAPLRLRQRAFGALLALSSEPRRFDAEDAMFVETVAHLTTTAASRVHAEKTLAAERRLSDEVLQTVGAMVVMLDGRGRIVRINRACSEITGFCSEDVEGRPIWDVFPLPEDADLFRSIFKKLERGVSPIEHEGRLLTKQSERRRIRWSYSALPGPDGSADSIVATGIDVTVERQAEERAAAAEQAARTARSAVGQTPDSVPDETADEPLDAAAEAARFPAAKPETPPRARRARAAPEFPIPINRERRQRQRLAYPYRQRIARIIDRRLPAKGEFAEIKCNDIAPGGFSFMSRKPPESEMLVVALGTPPNLTYLTAQVAHVTRTERGGEHVYLVGCSYVGRIAY